MSPNDLTLTQPQALLWLVADQACGGLPSQCSRRVYASRIRHYLEAQGQTLTRTAVQNHIKTLRDAGAGPATLNQTLSAIKLLVRELRVRELLPETESNAILEIRCARAKGVRLGQWLTLEQARELLKLPDRTTIVGLRDAAVLALTLGCGLRRSEAADVTWESYQAREGRMCLIDLLGKGARVRTVPVPGWAQRDLDRWREASRGAKFGQQTSQEAPETLRAPPTAILRSLTVLGRLNGRMSESGVWWVVKIYSDRMGVDFRPHDLRRSVAKLSFQASKDLEQVQLFLGHSRIETTARYLGGEQELRLGEAAVDKIGL